jgi:hypothetical protein
MLHKLKDLRGDKIAARDGEIGKVKRAPAPSIPRVSQTGSGRTAILRRRLLSGSPWWFR